MKTSLIMATHNRTNLLKWGLESLSKQKINHDFELWLLNDYYINDEETIKLYEQYKEKLNIKYLHTGKQKNGKNFWRNQGFCLNIAIKKCFGDIIILTCPEIFHLDNDSVNKIVDPFKNNEKIMTTPTHPKDDLSSNFLNYLEKNNNYSMELYNKSGNLKNEFHFFMGFKKSDLIEIGGFDEDFTGVAFDDGDLVRRLVKNGVKYHYVDVKLIHLFHKRNIAVIENFKERHEYNKKLYNERENIIKRNENREWGVL